jgi:DNA-binding IclR family transcriptional regulator
MNTKILGELIHDGELRATCRVVGVHKILCPDPETATEIAKATGLDRNTVTRALNELAEQEYISRDQQGRWVGEI